MKRPAPNPIESHSERPAARALSGAGLLRAASALACLLAIAWASASAAADTQPLDPYLPQPALAPTGEAGAGAFGASVALSADGSTALIGAPSDNSKAGAVFVYARSGSEWAQEVELVGAGGSGQGAFGASVALSADGSTALIGAPGTGPSSAGAAFVFTRSGTAWSQQGGKLTGPDTAHQFGASVALSADGSTALVGGPQTTVGPTATGAAFVFARSGGTWAAQGSALAASDETGAGAFGASVALSADGNTALIGGDGDAGGIGATWVFTRSGTAWSQQGGKLTGSGEIGAGAFGHGVALSADGNTTLVGGYLDNCAAGAAWVFVRGGTSWTQQGDKLTGPGDSGSCASRSGSGFGGAVALAADGDTALIAQGDESGSRIFTRSAGAWSLQAGGPSEQAGGASSAVALSADATTALVGRSGDGNGVGSAFVAVLAVPGPIQGVAVAPPAGAAPRLSALRVTPAAFRLATGSRSTGATRISYRDSQAARATFSVLRLTAGKRTSQGCLAPSRAPKSRVACTRAVPAGAFSHSDVAGVNSVSFSGVLGGHALTPGFYRLDLSASAGGRTSATASADLQIRA